MNRMEICFFSGFVPRQTQPKHRSAQGRSAVFRGWKEQSGHLQRRSIASPYASPDYISSCEQANKSNRNVNESFLIWFYWGFKKPLPPA